MNPFERFSAGQIFTQFDHKGVNIDPAAYPNVKKFLLTDVAITSPNILSHCTRIKSIQDIPPESIRGSLFYIYYQCDSDALPQLREIIRHGGKYVPPLIFNKTEFRFVDRPTLDVLRMTWAHAARFPQHLSLNVHENICEALQITKNVEGDFVEIGVYLGGSAFTALNYLKAIDRKRNAWLLDTFDGFNFQQALSSADIIWQRTHGLFGTPETMRVVSETLSLTGTAFKLVQSNICENDLSPEIKKIAVANIDVDLYESTRTALIKVAPLIARGGIIICEDPAATPGLYGAFVAMNEFLNDNPQGQEFLPVFKGGQYFLIRR